MDEILFGLSLVVVLSVVARLAATWLRVPAIVPLLVVGVLAGVSVTGLIKPEKLLGDALSPAVQIAVAVILFEGALGLKRADLASGVRPAVFRLVTLGVLATWLVSAVAVGLLFDLPYPIAVLIGAVLIVTGPTVVLPILDFIGPSPRARQILKWEGILIDPIGAVIAVVVFGSLSNVKGGAAFDLAEIFLSLGSGLVVGAIATVALLPVLSTRRLADRDKVAATLMMVVAAFAAADTIFDDSGLVAAIVMGVFLANQTEVRIGYIAEFKETLVPILVGILFVLLAANVEVSQVIDLGWKGLALVLILVLVGRPLAVMATAGISMPRNERIFLTAMAPRGIVAASTASAFGLQLVERGTPGGEKVIPITFLVIAGTVLIYALGAPPLARALGVAGESRPSLLMIGGPAWALKLGEGLGRAGAEVTVWTNSEGEARDAIAADLRVFGGPLKTDPSEPFALAHGVFVYALVSGDETLNEVLSAHLARIHEPDFVYRTRPDTERSPAVNSEAGLLFPNAAVAREVKRRLGAGEELQICAPGDPIPAGTIPVAGIRPTAGAIPAEVRFPTGSRPLRPDSRSTVLVLPPAATSSTPAAGSADGTAA